MSDHTPTPWTFNRIPHYEQADSTIIIDATRPFQSCVLKYVFRDEQDRRTTVFLGEILKTGGREEECEANAAFIVKAVNNHEPLVAELQRLFELYGHQATADVLASVGGSLHPGPETPTAERNT